MKKASVLLALSLMTLPSLAANQRLWIAGYRIGDSEIVVLNSGIYLLDD